ncbi:thioredoxin domain-containing protein [Sphingobacterium sp. SRCM116780]|uniref:TlpA family protein disulfide reductase n=1 Tax=Sphingobacterium sp. SRCM116780 TaxID=2907623 RepID=UPI001F406E29|nr:thioredoxin domain-containing protein [Sphingobacterium sp. SRCM116780]UIR57332.1 thioredoxin domain-containing protein [Sphingobacterium sp. SRCM116780]
MNNFIKGGRVHAFFQELFCQAKTKSNPDAKKQEKSVEILRDCLVAVRRVPEDQSKMYQREVEVRPVQSGTKDEAASKTSLTIIEAERNKFHGIGRITRAERLSRYFSWTCFTPTSNLPRTNFERPTLLHSSCTTLLPQLARENSGATAIKQRSSCKETPKLVRRKCEESPNMVSILFIVFQQFFGKIRNLSNCKSVCFSYHRNTRVTPRKEDKTTQLLPYECPRITPLNREEILKLLLKNGGSAKRLSKWSNFLRRLSAYFEYDRLCRGFKNVFIERVRGMKDGGTLRTIALHPIIRFFKTLNYSILLFTCLAVCPIIRLSAQEPRKDSGVNGLTFQLDNYIDFKFDQALTDKVKIEHPTIDFKQFPVKWYKIKEGKIKSISVGNQIPDSILNIPIWVVNDSLGREMLTLRELSFKKFIVLDFWARWCSPCLKSVDHWEEIHDAVKADIAVLPVNIDFDFWALKYAKDRKWKNTQVIGPAGYFFAQYFLGQALVGPNVWIKDGRLFGVTKASQSSYAFINLLRSGKIDELPVETRYPSVYSNSSNNSN